MPRGLTRQKINLNQVNRATLNVYYTLRLGPVWSKVLEDYPVRNKRCAFVTFRISDRRAHLSAGPLMAAFLTGALLCSRAGTSEPEENQLQLRRWMRLECRMSYPTPVRASRRTISEE